MNERDLREFRTRLQELQTSLTKQDSLGADAAKTVMLDQQSVGRLSRMDAMQQQAMARAGQARRKQMQHRIQMALARMEAGEYGYCTECGDDIAPQRLQLDPTIPTCITCARG